MAALLSGCGPSGRNDPSVEALVRKQVPAGFIREARQEDGVVYIYGLSLGEEHADLLPRLNQLPLLEDLRLNGLLLNEDDLQSLNALNFLRKIAFGSCQLTDDKMSHLQRFTNLTELSIAHSPITDQGLVHLRGMVRLRKLELINTKVRGQGFKSLQPLTNLRWIDLAGSPVDDDGIQSIGVFRKLETLYLTGTNVTRDGLMGLVHLHWLSSIGLPNAVVGPANDEQAKAKNLNLFYQDFCKANIEARKEARRAGEDVPPDDACPFTLTSEAVR